MVHEPALICLCLFYSSSSNLEIETISVPEFSSTEIVTTNRLIGMKTFAREVSVVVEKSPRSENPGQDGGDAEEKSTIKIFQKAVLVDDDDDNNEVQVTGSESFGAVEGSLVTIHVPLTEASFSEY